MSQIHNGNIKRSKQQDIPLKIFKIYAFYNQNLSGSRKGADEA